MTKKTRLATFKTEATLGTNVGNDVGVIVGENDELELDTAVGKIVGISVGVVVGGSVGSRLDDECGVCQFLLSTGGSA